MPRRGRRAGGCPRLGVCSERRSGSTPRIRCSPAAPSAGARAATTGARGASAAAQTRPAPPRAARPAALSRSSTQTPCAPGSVAIWPTSWRTGRRASRRRAPGAPSSTTWSTTFARIRARAHSRALHQRDRGPWLSNRPATSHQTPRHCQLSGLARGGLCIGGGGARVYAGCTTTAVRRWTMKLSLMSCTSAPRTRPAWPAARSTVASARRRRVSTSASSSSKR